MKKLAVLIALLLALSPVALALTLTDADIEYPIFSFGEYALRVSLYTDDPAVVAYEPVPAQGTLVMLRLTSYIGSVPLKDIEAGVSELILHDASDAVCQMVTWRERDALSVEGVPSITETEGAFELIYLVPAGVPVGGTTLYVGKADASEHIIVQMPGSGSGKIPEAEASAETESELTTDSTPEMTTPSESNPALTSPESADISFEGESFHLRPIAISKNEDGNTTVTVSGFGDSLKIRNGEMVVHIQAAILAGGQEYGWEGVSVEQGNATFSFNTDLAPEIIYLYPNGEPDNRTPLTVLASNNMQEPEPTQEAIPEAEEPEPTPEAVPVAEESVPTPSAAPDQTAVDFLNQLLSDEAEKASDPWTRAILEAGAIDVQLQDGTLAFALRSFNPGLKTIEETDAGGFMHHLYQNASTYDLQCMLEVMDDGGLAATDKARKALMKTIQKAAGQSKKAFNDKKVRMMLAGYLLGSPAMQDFESGWTPEQLAPLFTAQSKQTLSVNDGPHALNLGTTGVPSEDLLQKGYAAALQRLAKQPEANLLTEEEIEPVFLEELNNQAVALKKKGTEKFDLVLDIDALFSKDNPYAGDAFMIFLSGYTDSYNEKLLDLEDKVSAMPDYPAVDFPKSGRVGGSKSGTQVIYKTPKDGSARFIQMRKVDSGELAVSAFIRPGEKATVRVPKGTYYILLASGEIWYGEEHLFGDSGYYSRTEDIEIKGSNYYHTITLGGVEDGNMSSYGSDPSEFQ